MERIDDVRIKGLQELSPPEQVLRDIPASEELAEAVFQSRRTIHRILTGED